MDINATRTNASRSNHGESDHRGHAPMPPRRTEPGHTEYVGCKVIDERNRELGKIVDVAYDNDSGGAGALGEQPVWLVVDPGLFRAPHWMPVAGTYRSADGDLVVPWDRDVVKHSPKATDDHVMTPRLARELHDHYEVASLE